MRRLLLFAKTLPILLTAILALSIAPVSTYAKDGDKFDAEEIRYQVISEDAKTVRVTGILKGYDYKAVSGIVKIPETVSNDDGAVYLVTEIGEGCFANNGNFEEVILPQSITAIGEGAFFVCANLKSLVIPDAVTRLSGYSIYNCEKLQSIILPTALDYIDTSNIFYNCRSLESISIADSNTKYKTIDGVLYAYLFNDEQDDDGNIIFGREMWTLIRFPAYKSGPSFTIPDGIEAIGPYAFRGWCQTTQITIPASVKFLMAYSFKEMDNIESLTFLSETLPVISGSAFHGTDTFTIYVPSEEALKAFAKGGPSMSPGGKIRVELNPNGKPGASDPDDPGGDNNPGGNTGPNWPVIGGGATDYGSNQTTSDYRSLQGALEKAIQAANAANSGEASLRLMNYKSLDLDTLKQLAAAAKASGKRCMMYADTVEGNAVQVRVMFNPANAAKSIQLAGSVNSTGTRGIDALFERNFQNKVVVVELAQQGDFGMAVSIAARVNLAGFNTKTLYFYIYDKAKNIYSRIKNPKSRIDKNGYLWFDTRQAGYVIITDRPLQRK